jgi:hypothetical protein
VAGTGAAAQKPLTRLWTAWLSAARRQRGIVAPSFRDMAMFSLFTSFGPQQRPHCAPKGRLSGRRATWWTGVGDTGVYPSLITSRGTEAKS